MMKPGTRRTIMIMVEANRLNRNLPASYFWGVAIELGLSIGRVRQWMASPRWPEDLKQAGMRVTHPCPNPDPVCGCQVAHLHRCD